MKMQLAFYKMTPHNRILLFNQEDFVQNIYLNMRMKKGTTYLIVSKKIILTYKTKCAQDVVYGLNKFN